MRVVMIMVMVFIMFVMMSVFLFVNSERFLPVRNTPMVMVMIAIIVVRMCCAITVGMSVGFLLCACSAGSKQDKKKCQGENIFFHGYSIE